MRDTLEDDKTGWNTGATGQAGHGTRLWIVNCLAVVMAGLALLSGCGRGPAPADTMPRIGYLQLLEDPQLDEGRRGFLQALSDAGLVQDRDFVMEYRCAQGDQVLLPSLMQSFLRDRVRLIATSTTPCMLAAAHAVGHARDPVPVVITISSDPADFGLDPVPPNLTGYYNLNNMEEYLRVILACLPGPVRRLGLLSNPGEPNAELAAAAFTIACGEAEIELCRMPVHSFGDAAAAAQALAARDVQAIVTASDNLVYNAMPVIVRVAEKHRVPVFAAEAGIARLGAAVGWGLDYCDWGYQSGTVAGRLLKGAALSEEPLRPCTRYQIFLNEDSCRRQGLPITAELRRRASKII